MQCGPFKKLTTRLSVKANTSFSPMGKRILVIPRNNPIKPSTMGSIIKAAGITIEEFKKLL
jgi:hypothetical protein